MRRWTTGRRPRQAPACRVVCLPFAGGAASAYRSWDGLLPPGAELCPIQLPGRQNRLREPPAGDIQELARTLAEVLAPLLDRPYVLFGHSMGAVIGYELARRLERYGPRGPSHLVVSGAQPPDVPGLAARFVEMDDEELVRAGTVPAPVRANQDLLALTLPSLRADLEMCARYRPAPALPLDCPVTALGGRDDPLVPVEAIEGWRRHTAGDFTSATVPGGHMHLLDDPAAVVEHVVRTLPAAECRAVATRSAPGARQGR